MLRSWCSLELQLYPKSSASSLGYSRLSSGFFLNQPHHTLVVQRCHRKCLKKTNTLGILEPLTCGI